MFTKVHNLRDYHEYFQHNNRFTRCEKVTVDITEGLFFRKTKTVTLFKNWVDEWRYLNNGLEVPSCIGNQLSNLLNADYAKKVLDSAMKEQ